MNDTRSQLSFTEQNVGVDLKRSTRFKGQKTVDYFWRVDKNGVDNRKSNELD